ncbi:MAG TPA: peptide chain release factor N(5)-glutamine methyltransferase, partial [Jatrophihabitantaceae bacterium]|nr:peptide chain release factor N(5)-glutamine methyltransferase [Jatrophihabitantaceae bacterium]
MQVERSALALRADRPVDASHESAYAELMSRRVAREPLQYILGRAPFRHLLLEVGPGVFIPRPETELLVDAVLPQLRAIDAPRVVDLCSGSGALALSIANEVPAAFVLAVEADDAALPWLRRNADGTHVHVGRGDVADADLLADLRGSVDVVVSNPPYVPAAAIVDAEVRADPAVAVFGGADGLAVIPHVIRRAAELLRPGGQFAMEHESSQGRVVPELLRMDGRWTAIADHKDLAGRPRYVTATRT